MMTVAKYWEKAHLVREKTGKLPDKVFDFISIHRVTWRNDPKPYSLLSPLCLCTDSTRPDWESLRFRTKTEAIQFALTIAKHHHLRLVDCCEPRILK